MSEPSRVSGRVVVGSQNFCKVTTTRSLTRDGSDISLNLIQFSIICNMQKVLTAEEMREVDRLTTEKYGIPSILLMENAAHAAARIIAEKLGSVAGKSFLILCGKGNNGGDGASLARILWTQGAKVHVVLFGKIAETKDDAEINFKVLERLNGLSPKIRIEEVELTEEKARNWWKDFIYFFAVTKIDCIVDSVFGTGLTRPIDSSLGMIFGTLWTNITRRLNTLIIVSIDMPSGIKSDFSEPEGWHFYPDLTITFTAPKLANVFPPASNFNGELVVANIGSPQELIDNSPSQTYLSEREDAVNWLNQTNYTSNSYKNKRGHAFLIVGSKEYTGAAVLAGNAAMLSGVGLTTIATSESAQTAIAAKVLEEIITRALPETKSGAISEKAFETIEKLIEKVDVVGIGCGLGIQIPDSRFKKQKTKNLVTQIVENRKTPIVIDADGLNALSPFDLQGSDELPLILTPHEGEFLRLLGTTDKEVLKDRIKAVRDFAEKHKVILVLKGERTLIAAPDGRVVINPTGNSGLGKAGNGDTLTGIITGFVAQAVQAKVDIFETVVAAVYLAGLAGDIAAEKYGKRSMLASDVRECLGEAFAELVGVPSS
jgi:ADP-dependent NAD(P)H-hydrate dehydratase / NAD(P)H-hydrate epimerase